MKLDTNIHHVIEHCWKGFQGQRSKVKVICVQMCERLLLITNRRSNTGFGLIPTSMTLNDHKQRNSPYFAFFHRI